MELNGTGYLPRLADGLLTARLAAIGAVAIEGVKGCGKTATARRVAASEVLLDVDPQALQAVGIDPRLILDGATPRLIDEWQRAPAIWDAVRRAVDDRGRPGQFILTGSATPTDTAARHSGAGRFSVLTMRTMTLPEKGATVSTVSVGDLLRGDPIEPSRSDLAFADYLDHIVTGGWPQLIGASTDAARTFLEGYLDIIVDHDIAEISGGRRNPRLVRRFLHAYAQLTAHPAHLSTILARADDTAGDPGGAPSRSAAEPYLDALRRMMIVDEIPAWDPSLRSSSRLTATPKRMLADPSLAAALLDASTGRLARDLHTLGFLFEALVAHDLRIHAEAAGGRCYHYREREGRLEVDYVIETPAGDWAAFEVKLGAAAVDDAARSLLRLAERVFRPPAALAVVTAGAYAYTRDDGVAVIPLGCLGP
ncbi:MAG: ATP-binding protein [Thermoleophilia bacterium]